MKIKDIIKLLMNPALTRRMGLWIWSKGGVNKKAKSFVTIMIVIATAALALRIAVEKLIEINIQQNESIAQATLKLISAALENYAKNNKGIYPPNIPLLSHTTPAYLNKDYTQSPLKGYIYSCNRLDATGYSCSAAPTNCRLTGRTVYTVTTGGLLVSEGCERKE